LLDGPYEGAKNGRKLPFLFGCVAAPFQSKAEGFLCVAVIGLLSSVLGRLSPVGKSSNRAYKFALTLYPRNYCLPMTGALGQAL